MLLQVFLMLLAYVSILAATFGLFGARRLNRLIGLTLPLLLLGSAALMWWSFDQASFDSMVSESKEGSFVKHAQVATDQALFGKHTHTYMLFFVLNAQITSWSTLLLNCSDLGRFVCSQRDNVLGLAVGITLSNMFMIFVGSSMACATAHRGEAVWFLPDVLQYWVTSVAVPVGYIAAFTTVVPNIAANIISPTNDLLALLPANAVPYRFAGIALIFGSLAACPWYAFNSANRFIFQLVDAYGKRYTSLVTDVAQPAFDNLPLKIHK